MGRVVRRSNLMFDVPPEAPLWAVANEARHWSAKDLAPLKQDPSALEALMGIPRGRQQRLIRGKDEPRQVATRQPLDRRDLEARIARAHTELLSMLFSGIQPLPLFDNEYPKRLAKIPNPPLILYVLGALTSFDPCVAVSGTRSPSPWGARTAADLAGGLAKAGWTVTSGLARGIDTQAHRGALEIPGATTVAVSALTLDRVYPPENLELAQQIVDRGALVTEHALSGGLGGVEFLRRNRIISGLSFAQFIVETTGTGGSLSQATTAIEQGRPLFAMRPPARETKATRGFKILVKLGATPVETVNEGIAHAAELWAAQVE